MWIHFIRLLDYWHFTWAALALDTHAGSDCLALGLGTFRYFHQNMQIKTRENHLRGEKYIVIKKEKASGSWPINTREIGFWIFDALHQTCEIFQELLTLILKWNNPTYHDGCVSWIVKVFPGVSRKYFELAHFYILFSALLFVFVFCQFPFRAFLFPPVSLFKAQPVGQVFLTRHQLLCFFKRRFMKFHFRCFVDVSWLQWVFFHVFLNVVSLDRFLRLPVFVSPASRVNQSSPFTRVLCGCTCLPR